MSTVETIALLSLVIAAVSLGYKLGKDIKKYPPPDPQQEAAISSNLLVLAGFLLAPGRPPFLPLIIPSIVHFVNHLLIWRVAFFCLLTQFLALLKNF